MNLVQWKAYKGYLPKVSYIYGSDCTIVRLAVESLIEKVNPSDVIKIDLSFDQEINIWLALSQYSLDSDSPNLIVVYSSEKLRDWSYLELWLAEGNSGNYISFVTSETALDAELPHVALIKKKGKLVSCSDVGDEGLLSLIEERGLDRKTAELLLEKTSGNVKAILNLIEKAEAIGGMNEKAVGILCNELALDPFSDYLIFGDKQAALKSLDGMCKDDILRELSILFNRLQFLSELNDCVMLRMPQMDIVSKLRVKAFLVKKYINVAKNFSERTVTRRRLIVAMAESAVRNNSRGSLEALVALW